MLDQKRVAYTTVEFAAESFTAEEAAEKLGERPEDVFYWNHGADAAASREALARIEIAVFGVNHIALPLIGNLRGCGFRVHSSISMTGAGASG